MRVSLRTVFALPVLLVLSGCNSTSTGGAGALNDQTGASSLTSKGVPISIVLTGTAALDSEEIAFLHLINDYRAQNGLSALEVSIDLTQASDWMSHDMASKNYFSHTDQDGRDPFARMAAFGYDYSTYSGENIAAGNADAQSTFTQWKNSAGHNQNMLSPSYRVIGIGRASGGSYGWVWTTDFGGYVDATVSP